MLMGRIAKSMLKAALNDEKPLFKSMENSSCHATSSDVQGKL